MTGNDTFRYEKRDERNWRGTHAGTNQQIFAGGKECAAIEEGVPITPGVVDVDQTGWPVVRVVQQPKANIVFPAINYGHEGKKNVMKRACDDGRENVAASQPGEEYGGGSFEADDWNETKENADGNAAGNGFGSVPNRQQL